MTGRIRRQGQPAPFESLAIRQTSRRPRAIAKLIKSCRGGRAQGVFVPSHVIGVCVGHECPRLPATKIDRQVGLGQLESAVEVKHSVVVGGSWLEILDFGLEVEEKTRLRPTTALPSRHHCQLARRTQTGRLPCLIESGAHGLHDSLASNA